jgi:hypothetical protein
MIPPLNKAPRTMPTGNEVPAICTGKKTSAPKGGAMGGALCGDSDPTDPDLALLNDRWPVLPSQAQAAIMALLQNTGRSG